MSDRIFRLGAVLRAREVQEKVAKGALAQANAQVEAAAQDVRRRTAALEACTTMLDGSALHFVATMTLRTSLARELAESELGKSFADDVAAERAGEWTAAAIRRRSLERLAERHAETLAAEEMRLSQMEIDDRAGRPVAPIGTTSAATEEAPDEHR